MSSLYGLVGFSLEHSFSPAYFKKKFASEGIDAEYNTFPLEAIEEFEALLQKYPTVNGLNVTIPYKECVIEYLDALDTDAKEVNAVNCIKLIDGKTIGYNTDVIGFEQSLTPSLQPDMNKALVLGSGGASKAVQFVLNKLGISFQVVSRTKSEHTITYKELSEDVVKERKVIINTTPLGMYPDIDTCPEIVYDAITSEHLLYDLIYNPEETMFLQIGKDKGASIKNGLEMLELQAEESWKIWHL